MGDKIVEIKTKSEHLANFWAMFGSLCARCGNEEASNHCIQESIHYQYFGDNDPKLYRGTLEILTLTKNNM